MYVLHWGLALGTVEVLELYALHKQLATLRPKQIRVAELGGYQPALGTLMWVCFAGAIVPDIPAIIQILLNLAADHSLSVAIRLDDFPPALRTWTIILHNYWLWTLLTCLVFFVDDVFYGIRGEQKLAQVFALGGWFCHIPFDVISHGHGSEFQGVNYFQGLLPDTFVKALGIPHYNYGTDVWVERLALLFVAALTLWMERKRHALEQQTRLSLAFSAAV